MVTFCMAPGCSNKSKRNNVHFHRLLLNDKGKLKIWVYNTKLKDPPINKYSRICSDHFTEDCYIKNLQAKLTGLKRQVRLKKDAVLTIFDFYLYKPAVSGASSRLESSAAQTRKLRRENRAQRKTIQQVN